MSAVHLPPSQWRESEGFKNLVTALWDDEDGPRIVGGAVRDGLLGIQVSDIDLATKLHPQTVIDRLEEARIKAIPTGIDHGTITAVSQGKTFEITTLRRDVSTDGRRATVVFATDWKEDAARRDFTINALYADPVSGEIFDYFGGVEDLNAHIVRFIGDPTERIAEDHLRILRYFRFLARFGEENLDPDAIAACSATAKSLMALSRERIAGEILKILTISLMIENNIFASFLPEISCDAATKFGRLLAREKSYAAPVSIIARLLALLSPESVIVDKVAMRLKLSNKMRVDLATRLENQAPTPDTVRSIAYRHGIECARDAALLFAPDPDLPACIAKLEDWTPPSFPIKGGDLITRGLTAGPVVAKTLKAIEVAWIVEGFPEPKRALELTDQFVAGALLATKNS
jgi:poly(A) polymerase